MASNFESDQAKLILNGKENVSSHPNVNNFGANSYGTFLDDAGGLPVTTTTVSSYPYAFNSQSPTIIVLGGCPACKTGMLQTDFTFLGVCCAIFFFPIGIICCLAFRQRRCDFCGAIYP